ncbi:hypothetical protein VPH35_105676 [Triticum aestivum]
MPVAGDYTQQAHTTNQEFWFWKRMQGRVWCTVLRGCMAFFPHGTFKNVVGWCACALNESNEIDFFSKNWTWRCQHKKIATLAGLDILVSVVLLPSVARI